MDLLKGNYKNIYYYLDGFIVGLTSKKKEFKIDIKDFPKVSKYRWSQNSAGYINANINGEVKFLHRFLLNPLNNLEIDHINMDKADCRNENLRVCTNSQNQANKKIMINNTSGFKGVTWHKRNKKWVARISYYNKRINLGSFDNLYDAVNVYNNKAKELYGKYARVSDKRMVRA